MISHQKLRRPEECNIFKVQKGKPKNLSTKNFIPSKNILKEYTEIKTFSDERKLSEFIANSPALKHLEDVFKLKGNDNR